MAFKRVIPDKINLKGLKSGEIDKLKIKCSSTQCGNDLHCFTRYMKRAEKKFGKKGVCYNCGDGHIDWERIHKNDINDSKYIFESLNQELIRNVFAEAKIDKEALESAKLKDKQQLREEASKLLKKRIAKYNSYIDSKQTPLGKDNIVNYAQHATGTCCRSCLEAWHNIPKEQVLTDKQLEFCTDLVMLYIEKKIPDLKKNHEDTGK